MQSFRESSAAVDALLLDDLPSATNRHVTREAIYAEIHALLIQDVRIVVTCNVRPPALPRRLLEVASLVEVGYPDLTARTEIARRETERCDFAMPDAALRSLAAHSSGSPRQLQSAIARMVAEALLSS